MSPCRYQVRREPSAVAAVEKGVKLSRRNYQNWFMAAAIYNFIWGTAVVLAPDVIFRAMRIAQPNYPSLFQAIGMMVMVYSLGYWLIAKDPERYAAFVWVGLLGKVFGPVGFLFAVSRGELPWSFGVTILTNDLIWWPVFFSFAWHYARNPIVEPRSLR